MKIKHTLIVGGGAIGLFSALFLRKAGYAVTIVDKGPVPGLHACSSGNAGLIVPSHFVPIATRSTIREGVANLFKPSAPFGLKWSFNPELFGWLWEFYKNSGSTNMDSKTKFLADFHLASRELYRSIQEKDGINLTLNLSGLHMVSEREATFRNDTATACKADKLGIPAEIWSADQYRDQNPTLDARLAGAVFYPWDGMVDPLPMLNHLKSWLMTNGVEILENTNVFDWKTSRSGIEAICIDDREITADHYLLCAGEKSGSVLKGTGLSVPLQPATGYSFLFRNATKPVSHPALLQDRHVAITPYSTHTRIAGNFLLGFQGSANSGKRIGRIRQSVEETFPGWDIPVVRKEHVWSGQRPVSPDGLPMIGKSSVYNNLSIATGHAMMGISLAPVTGSLIAAWIGGKDEGSAWKKHLSPDRFGNRF
jgi:D-amino-acid dehydrogenase